MNRDLVAGIPAATILPDLAPAASPLVETPVSDTMAGQGASLLLAHGATEYLGGSAFNAARVAALLNAGDQRHHLSFLGIAGSVGGTSPHLAALKAWQVNSDGVQQSPLPPATCLAMVESAGRTLLTASGANASIADFLRERREELARCVASCDLIHVTSYLDPDAPALVAELLHRARQHNPQLLVSLDPGAAWVIPGGPGFDRLLAQSNILHLNNEEFSHLRDAGAALSTMTDRLVPGYRLIVARNHASVAMHEQRSGGKTASTHLPETPLPAEIRDATGAGDTFCGAFLWHFLGRRDNPLDAARHGFALARAKVGIDGPITENLVRIHLARLGEASLPA